MHRFNGWPSSTQNWFSYSPVECQICDHQRTGATWKHVEYVKSFLDLIFIKNENYSECKFFSSPFFLSFFFLSFFLVFFFFSCLCQHIDWRITAHGFTKSIQKNIIYNLRKSWDLRWKRIGYIIKRWTYVPNITLRLALSLLKWDGRGTLHRDTAMCSNSQLARGMCPRTSGSNVNDLSRHHYHCFASQLNL